MIFTHPRYGEKVESISGHYVPEREETLKFKGRDLLYIIGYGVVDGSCCGVGGCYYALVAGYAVRLKYDRNYDGLFLSEVEPVENEKEIAEIKRILTKCESVTQVDFL